jgi:hypothetical protein
MGFDIRKNVGGIAVIVLQITALCSAQLQQITAFELINNYERTRQLSLRHIARVVSLNESRDSLSGNTLRFSKTETELRYDGNRYDVIAKRWDNLKSKDSLTPPELSSGYRQIWDGKMVVDGWYFKGNNYNELDSDRLTISHDPNLAGHNEKYFADALFFGYFSGDMEPISAVLRDSEEIKVRESMEAVGNSLCYVIEAKGKHGKYAVWIDPEHGYNIAKAKVHKTGHDLVYGEVMDTNPPQWIPQLKMYQQKATELAFSLDNVRFEKVNDVWVPMELNIESRDVFNKERTIATKNCLKRTHIDINPDFEAIGAFVVHIPNGTKISVPEIPGGVRYEWRDGRVIADIDKLIFDVIESAIKEEKDRVRTEVTSMNNKKVEVLGNKPATIAKPQFNEQVNKQSSSLKTQQELVSGLVSFPSLALILTGLLSVGVIGWLVFRHCKNGGKHV